MYTYTPTHRFLVLSATESGPYDPTNKFLVLSPTESGPDPRVWDNQPQTETNSADKSPQMTPNRARTNSSLSTSSSSSLNDLVATLPNGFLYLGHGKKH